MNLEVNLAQAYALNNLTPVTDSSFLLYDGGPTAWLHPPRRSANEAQRGGAVGWKPLLGGAVVYEKFFNTSGMYTRCKRTSAMPR